LASIVRVASREFGPSEKASDALVVSRLSVGWDVELNYTVITGPREGPVLYVGAGSHGDEVTSIYAALRVAKELGPDDLERGAIVVVPIHNPVAVLHKRRWGFIDNLDMNRVWPGDPEGTISEVLTDTIFRSFVLESDYVLDLHTAASDGANVPHAIAPPEGWFKPREGRSYAARTDDSLLMAKYFGVRFAKKTQAKEVKKYYAYYPGELHVAAPQHGIPAIVVELGEGGRLSMDEYRLGYNGVLNVAKWLGILKGDPVEHEEPIMLGEFKSVRAPVGGVVALKVGLGEYVEEGSVVAYIETPRETVEVKTPHSGYVVRVRRYAVVEPGERVVVVSSPEKG
jgi:hypothetical protein